jgi:hypothetical protein
VAGAGQAPSDGESPAGWEIEWEQNQKIEDTKVEMYQSITNQSGILNAMLKAMRQAR